MESQQSRAEPAVRGESEGPGFYQPAEWEFHESVWLAWPCHKELWQENLPRAQEEFIAFCKAIADQDGSTGRWRGERLRVLVANEEASAEARGALETLPADFHLVPYGDIWLRDTAPVFLKGPGHSRVCARFAFNGWGEKYVLPHDAGVAERIARIAGFDDIHWPQVLEGGAVEVDGDGTCITTEQCLLNPNRNPGMTKDEIETWLGECLGVRNVLWVRRGLHNDHTDGHIDTLVRFIAPGRVVCMKPREENDPNGEVLNEVVHDLRSMKDASGYALDITFVPSPGAVRTSEGELLAASYVNFYIANTVVVVPTYGTKWDEEAVATIADCFPDRRTVGLSARAILTGGGAFHCISQQQPS